MALSQRNKEQFAERMGAAAPVVEELAKVEASTWRQMKGLFSSLESVGRSGMYSNFTGRMQQAALLPLNVLQNRLAFMIEGWMMPLLPLVNQAVQSYENYVMKNQTGAMIGGTLGLLIGALLGQPLLGGFLGGGIGAGVEESLGIYERFTEQGGRAFPYRSPSGATPSDPLGGASDGGGSMDSPGTGDPGEGYVKPPYQYTYTIAFIEGRRRVV